jgi:hypothetical protein
MVHKRRLSRFFAAARMKGPRTICKRGARATRWVIVCPHGDTRFREGLLRFLRLFEMRSFGLQKTDECIVRFGRRFGIIALPSDKVRWCRIASIFPNLSACDASPRLTAHFLDIVIDKLSTILGRHRCFRTLFFVSLPVIRRSITRRYSLTASSMASFTTSTLPKIRFASSVHLAPRRGSGGVSDRLQHRLRPKPGCSGADLASLRLRHRLFTRKIKRKNH